MMNRLLPRTLRALAVLVAATVVALVVGELLIRATDVDWRYAKRLLYFQGVDLPSHVAVPDGDLRYRLRPGVADYGPHFDYGAYRVEINSLGYRSPERPMEKPPGVFRVLCVGGSNVYGLLVSNDQTWPAQLEKRLNERGRGRFEVWNAGTPAYVGVQMIARAEEALRTIRPDLVLIAPSNTGTRAFLKDAPVAPYFARDPALWLREVPPSYFAWPSWIPLGAKLWLMGHVRLYRAALLGGMAATGDDLVWNSEDGDRENVAAVRRFVTRHRGEVGMMMFVCPACQNTPGFLHHYYDHLDVPLFILAAPGLPGPYRRMHAPPSVYAWYGEKIAEWLVRERLVPTGEARIRGPQ
jgi:hypothetical protein